MKSIKSGGFFFFLALEDGPERVLHRSRDNAREMHTGRRGEEAVGAEAGGLKGGGCFMLIFIV